MFNRKRVTFRFRTVWFYKAPAYHGLRVIKSCKHVYLRRKSQKPAVRVAETFLLAWTLQFSSVQSLSHVWLFATPMNCSTPRLPVHHQLPESTQTQVHWVGDAIQPSHPLSAPSPPALNLSQHQGLFKWVSPLHQVAKVLEFQLQHQSFQWIPWTDLL